MKILRYIKSFFVPITEKKPIYIGKTNQEIPFKEMVKKLRKDSKYYPSILTVYYDRINTKSVSTLVRIQIENTWYIVHCVESGIYADEKILLQKLITSVHRIQNMTEKTPFHEKDTNQISEKERLMKMEEELIIL